MDMKEKIQRQLKQLEMVALNLKIESARIKQDNSIGVVADKIEKTIKEIEKEIDTI